MSIYIGNDLEDRLKILETENASLKKYNEYHQVVHEIDHVSNLHVDSIFISNQWKLITTSKLRNKSILQQVNQQWFNHWREKDLNYRI